MENESLRLKLNVKPERKTRCNRLLGINWLETILQSTFAIKVCAMKTTRELLTTAAIEPGGASACSDKGLEKLMAHVSCECSKNV